MPRILWSLLDIFRRPRRQREIDAAVAQPLAAWNAFYRRDFDSAGRLCAPARAAVGGQPPFDLGLVLSLMEGWRAAGLDLVLAGATKVTVPNRHAPDFPIPEHYASYLTA